jgi:phage tail sheath protein FI
MPNNTYYTPGVYVEEISKFPPSITAVQTAIPAFIGYTQIARKDGKDLKNVPLRISSLLEYESYFGLAQKEENLLVTVEQEPAGLRYNVAFNPDPAKPASRHLMYYAMQQFFDNGGGPCYIISVGAYLTSLGAPITDTDAYLKALEELKKLDEPTLIVIPEGQAIAASSVDNYMQILQSALKQCVLLKDRFTIIDLPHTGAGITTESDILAAAEDFRNKLTATSDELRFGAAYFPNIRSAFNYAYDESKIRILTLAGEKGFNDLTSLEKANVKLAIDSFSITLPPSASVAGVYARVDNARGVWKAPANEVLKSVFELTTDINDQIQQKLNVDENNGKSINAIRFFSGKGIKIWGARTLDGNSNEWRYVSVRRYFNMVEESTKKATEQFVFEPNDANTWVKVRAMIENFLTNQWRAGALAGAKTEHAFYVKVGLNETMTAMDILEGKMIVEIGLAVVRPAEFIILRFSHKMQES